MKGRPTWYSQRDSSRGFQSPEVYRHTAPSTLAPKPIGLSTEFQSSFAGRLGWKIPTTNCGASLRRNNFPWRILMFPSEAQTAPSGEVQCDLDYRISRAQPIPHMHLSKNCTHTNFFVPGVCSYLRPNARLVASRMRFSSSFGCIDCLFITE